MTELTDKLQAIVDRLATTSSDPKWITEELNEAISMESVPVISDVKNTLVLKASNIGLRDAFAMTVMRERLADLDGTDEAIAAMWVEAYRIADIGVEKGKEAAAGA